MLTKKQVCKLKSNIKKHEVPVIIPYDLYYLLRWEHEPRYYRALGEYTKAEVKELSEEYLRKRHFIKIAKELGLLDENYKKTRLCNRLFTNKLVQY